MTHDQLLPIYRQITGLGGQDDAYNHWVQGIIDASHSSGTDAIPDNFFDTSAGQQYLQSTTTTNQPYGNGGGTTAPTAPTAPTGTSPSGLGGLIQPTTTTPDFSQAPNPSVAGGNYNQVQNSTQGGQFATTGSTLATQTGATSGTQNGTQSSTGQQTTSGTSTSTPDDTLGFGALLKDQATGVGASDAARTSFLTDLMQNGGTGFNQQLDAGIRNSLTGPQLTGAGDSARARAAGYAAANVGRDNLGQRLQASSQLAAPTGLAALSTAANPYIGQTNTNSGSSDSITNAVNSMNSTGLSSLLSKTNENQAGSTTAQSSQSGAGEIPQGQPVKSGGCVLCTAAIELKLPHSRILRVLRRVISHKLHTERHRFSNASRGYFAVFTPIASFLLSHPKLARLLWPTAQAVVYEELRVSGRRLPFRILPWAVHWTGHIICVAVGATLPVKGYVDNVRILDIARRNNILFEVQS